MTTAEWTWVWSPSARYEPTFLVDAVISGMVLGTSGERDVVRTQSSDGQRTGARTLEPTHVG